MLHKRDIVPSYLVQCADVLYAEVMAFSPSLPSPSRKLKVAVYLNDLSSGGMERRKLILIHAMHRAGAEIMLLLHSKKGPLELDLPEGVQVKVFDTRRVLNDVGPIARYLRQAEPDILLSSLNHNNVTACLAGLLAGGRTKVVICQHNALSQEAHPTRGWKYRVMPIAYRLVAPLAAGIVVVSKGVGEDMAEVTGIAARRITVIYNPIFDDELLARISAPVHHPWFDEPLPIYISAGRLVEQKNQAMLLRGFAEYRKQHTGRLMIFGEGPKREQLEHLAAELGIAGDVAFCGFVENPMPYYRFAKAFILTSRFEGFGNVLVEAMAGGLPVISTDCPHGPAEILDGGKFGRLVPIDDIAALATAMAEDLAACFPPPMLQSRAAEFSTEASTKGYLALFNAVVGAEN